MNGAHDSDKLQDLLDGFIRKFVLCPECDNPETNLVCMIKLVLSWLLHFAVRNSIFKVVVINLRYYLDTVIVLG